jgi:ATP-dependent Lon protease
MADDQNGKLKDKRTVGGEEGGASDASDRVEVISPEQARVARSLARIEDDLPAVLFVLPIDDQVLFPQMVLPLAIQGKRALSTLEQVKEQGSFVGIVARRPGKGSEGDEEDPTTSLYHVGTVARVIQQIDFPDGSRGLMVGGLRRMRIKRFLKTEPVLIVEPEYPEENQRDRKAERALTPHLRQGFEELVKLRPDMPDEMAGLASRVEDAGRLADFITVNSGLELAERQSVLANFDVDSRIEQVFGFLDRQLDLARLGEKTRSEFKEKMEQAQREHYLREQLKLIKQELGEEVDEKSMEAEDYDRRIAEAQMPEEVEERARYELKRLKVLPQEAAEYHVIRTYLDWLCDLPWAKRSEENEDVSRAERILEEDHYGLEEVKARIVEFLAVRKLRPDRGGAILCLVGPPGVGKTSLGQSVARAMNREFTRMSLGGMRDEAEIKGHRRTYVGAMPGRIIRGLRRVGTRNPVFMLDEIDKLGSDWRGDPSSAMLEVLDPAQNHAFEDHYLDVAFDLTDVMFIATGNYAGQIPQPLMDRMEVIEIPGYIPDEKKKIASRYLVKRQREENGLSAKQLRINERTLAAIVKGWTRESGVRELERRIGQISRKVAAAIVTGRKSEDEKHTIKPEDLPEYLGPKKFGRAPEARVTKPGIAIGLAWTPVGGDVLFIEVLPTAGKGQVKVTGKLGDVMSESAQIAHSVARAHALRYGIGEDYFRTHDLHIHVPEGSVPKDGPSAGITLTTAIVSAATRGGRGVKVKANVAMTGEITLRGQVLPVGGIREKTVAAKAAGIRTLILCKENEPDAEQLPDRVRRGLTFHFVEDIEDVLRHAFPASWSRSHLAPENG